MTIQSEARNAALEGITVSIRALAGDLMSTSDPGAARLNALDDALFVLDEHRDALSYLGTEGVRDVVAQLMVAEFEPDSFVSSLRQMSIDDKLASATELARNDPQAEQLRAQARAERFALIADLANLGSEAARGAMAVALLVAIDRAAEAEPEPASEPGAIAG